MLITGIMGSDMIKGALDQRFILDQLTQVSQKRHALISLINSDEAHQKDCQLDTLVSTLDTLVE